MNIPILSDIVKKHQKKITNTNKELIIRQIVREIINEMVKDIIINTKKNLKKNKVKSINDVYNFKNKIVCFSKKFILFDLAIKNFLRTNMYYSKVVLKKTNDGKKIIKSLLSTILQT